MTKKEQDAKYYEANKERIKVRAQAYYIANKEKARESAKLRYEKNKEKILAQNKNWRKENPERYAELQQNYVKRNRGIWTAQTARYRAAKKQATPLWADLEKIKQLYKLAAAWNEIWPEDTVHVDHIIPIKGKNVSGLHTELNLQILRATDNKKKSNKLINL